ncbi:hypothetical protein D3C76_1418330 [compost metagenome]
MPTCTCASSNSTPQAVTNTTITSSARLTCSRTWPTCFRIAPISSRLTVGNSRFNCVNMPLPFSQRKLVSQLCGCPSSAPDGKIKKKFGRRLSQSTLRRLVTLALKP